MTDLSVWLTLPDGEQAPVGVLATHGPDARGWLRSEFRYHAGWLGRPDAFPLDPVHLPLAPASVVARSIEAPLAIFDDALPDDWGRPLLVQAHQLQSATRTAPHLLRALGANALGALAFAAPDETPANSRRPESHVHLRELLDTALVIERGGTPRPSALARLLAAGSSPGGSRPKVVVRDDTGTGWIAKFPSPARDGGVDVIGLEATCMALARECGLVVPETRIEKLGRQKVLLVRRFDLAPGNGRYHMTSLRTLCGERPGVHVNSYGEVAAMIQRVTRDPDDIERFFRQMVFNAAIGNTDDHLKNFWMLRGPNGYVLSPAFDLVPDVARRREHSLAFQYEHRCPDRATLLDLARAWCVRDAVDVIDAIVRPLAGFADAARAHGVAVASIREIGKDVVERLRRIGRG